MVITMVPLHLAFSVKPIIARQSNTYLLVHNIRIIAHAILCSLRKKDTIVSLCEGTDTILPTCLENKSTCRIQ